jgi:hypothetical protein
MHGPGQVEDLLAQLDQLLVLLILLLDHPPLVVGGGLALEVGAVLADHHERRQEDRLQRDDHGQQPERVALDAKDDPDREPDDVEADERHRAGEPGDGVRDAVLQSCRPGLGVLGQRGAQRQGQLGR